MVNMKISPEQAQKDYAPTSVADAPEYPWGLSINLDEQSIKKLGLPALPQVGQTMMITARVNVNSVSSNDTQQDGVQRSMSLQITDMEIGADKPETNPGESLYNGS